MKNHDMAKTYPGWWETSVEISSGEKALFRPARPADEDMLHDFFYSLSERSIYYRFFSHLKSFPPNFLRRFIDIDYRNEMTVVGLIQERECESIIAAGYYVLNSATNMGEVALIVRDDWQDKGIGTLLLDYLIMIARESGLSGFTAEVLKDNAPMIKLFQKAGFTVYPGYGKSTRVAELKFTRNNKSHENNV